MQLNKGWKVMDVFGKEKGCVTFNMRSKAEALAFMREYVELNYEQKGFIVSLDTENKSATYQNKNMSVLGVVTFFNLE